MAGNNQKKRNQQRAKGSATQQDQDTATKQKTEEVSDSHQGDSNKPATEKTDAVNTLPTEASKPPAIPKDPQGIDDVIPTWSMDDVEPTDTEPGVAPLEPKQHDKEPHACVQQVPTSTVEISQIWKCYNKDRRAYWGLLYISNLQ